MNKVILAKLPLEYKALWEVSKQKPLDSGLKEVLTKQIRNAKRNFKSTSPEDQLAQKLRVFNNEGAWGRAKIKELAEAIYKDKAPEKIEVGTWISVEIECIFRKESDENMIIQYIRKHGLTKSVTFKNDGSIHPTQEQCECAREDEEGNSIDCECGANETRNHYGREIVVTFQFGKWEILRNICAELNKYKATVNKTCGLHVHFDCRHLTARQVTTIGKRVANVVPALKQILPKSRSDNRFCAEPMNTHKNSQGSGRYAFVNLGAYARHQTLEIRGHSGTTDANKIINWIRLLRKVMDTRSAVPINTASELIQKFKFESDLAEYVAVRFSKFNKVTSQVSDDVLADNSPQEELTPDLPAPISVPQLVNWMNRDWYTSLNEVVATVAPAVEPGSMEGLNISTAAMEQLRQLFRSSPQSGVISNTVTVTVPTSSGNEEAETA